MILSGGRFSPPPNLTPYPERDNFIITTEPLIDPSNLSSYPLPSSSELTLYRVADQVVRVVKAVPADFIFDTTGRKTVELEKALNFEPYHSMHVRCIDKLFDEDLANQEVEDSFLQDLAADLQWSNVPEPSHHSGQMQHLLWQKPSELLVETSGKYTF